MLLELKIYPDIVSKVGRTEEIYSLERTKVKSDHFLNRFCNQVKALSLRIR